MSSAQAKVQTSDNSQLGAAFATWRQSHTMLLGRVNQLIDFTRSLRKGNLSGASRALGLRPGSVKSHAKSFAGQWLEYSYGWKPLIQDIGNAVEVLQTPIASDYIPVTGRASGTFTASWDHDTFFNEGTWVCHAQWKADVRVSNPNAWLANQLGFVNPATVAWEVIPYSFVVDWFIPVGEFLQSFTDFVGLDLTNYCQTYYGVHDYFQYWKNAAYPPWGKRRVQVRRIVSSPSLSLKPRFTGFYSARGANAIALLLQHLR